MKGTRKNKLFILVLVVLLLALTAMGCSSNAPASQGSGSDTSAPSTAPADEGDGYLVGFINYNKEIEFTRIVADSMQLNADLHGVDLIYTEAGADAQTMLSSTDTLLMQGIDLLVDFNFTPDVMVQMVEKTNAKGVPAIGIDCLPVDDMWWFFGANNYQAGVIAGKAAADYVVNEWGGQLDSLVLIGHEAAGPDVKNRSLGVIEGLENAGINLSDDQIYWMDNCTDAQKSQAQGADFLTGHPNDRHILVAVASAPGAIGFNSATIAAGRVSDVAIFCQNEDSGVQDVIREGGSSIIGAVAFFPEKYGDRIIPLAISIIKGENPPKMNYTEHIVVTHDNINSIFPN